MKRKSLIFMLYIIWLHTKNQKKAVWQFLGIANLHNHFILEFWNFNFSFLAKFHASIEVAPKLL
jgi:hypothetical protein